MRRSWTPWALLVLAAGGCAPGKVLDRPAGWPETWKGRELYNTPRAYIYAGSDAAAGEADRIAAAAARDFERDGGRNAPKILLIVMDAREEFVTTDLKGFCRAVLRVDHISGEKAPTPEETDEDWARLAREMAELDMPLVSLLAMKPTVLNRAELAELLGLGPKVTDAVAWGLVVPTRALCGLVAGKMLAGMLKRAEVGPVRRAALAPFLAMAQCAAARMAPVMGRIVLFGQFVHAQPDWSAEQKKAKVERYMQAEGKKALGLLGGMLPADDDN